MYRVDFFHFVSFVIIRTSKMRFNLEKNINFHDYIFITFNLNYTRFVPGLFLSQH